MANFMLVKNKNINKWLGIESCYCEFMFLMSSLQKKNNS